MPWNSLLLLPFLAGYWFPLAAHRFRFRAERLTGPRVLAEAGLWGVLWFAVACAFVTLAQGVPEALINGNAASNSPEFAKVCVLAFLVGLLAHFPFNYYGAFRERKGGALADSEFPILKAEPKSLLKRLSQRRRWKRRNIYSLMNSASSPTVSQTVRKWLNEIKELSLRNARRLAIKEHGNSLDALLQSAADDWTLLLITLKSGMVYAGFILDGPSLRLSERFLKLLPRKYGLMQSNGEIRWAVMYSGRMIEPQPGAAGFQTADQAGDFRHQDPPLYGSGPEAAQVTISLDSIDSVEPVIVDLYEQPPPGLLPTEPDAEVTLFC